MLSPQLGSNPLIFGEVLYVYFLSSISSNFLKIGERIAPPICLRSVPIGEILHELINLENFPLQRCLSLVNLSNMFECQVKNSWDQFVEFIESRSSKAEFQNWIAPIRLIEALTNKIILEVPNVYVQNYLLDNFSEVLSNFLPLFPSGDPAIQFIIPDQEPVKQHPISIPPEKEEVEGNQHDLSLNHLYTFENFIEGPSNQFVKSAAFGVAARPGVSRANLMWGRHLLRPLARRSTVDGAQRRCQLPGAAGVVHVMLTHLRAYH